MRKFLIIMLLGLVGACADTPGQKDAEETKAGEPCPSWQIPVVEDDHIHCTDRDILEREREIIEDEEHW